MDVAQIGPAWRRIEISPRSGLKVMISSRWRGLCYNDYLRLAYCRFRRLKITFLYQLKMKDSRKKLGGLGEQLAVEKLQRRGYEILARNWRCPYGEIDIIARHQNALIIVEVKTRRGRYAGTPEQGVDDRKQAKLCRLAQHYAESVGWEGDVRIDVVGVELSPAGKLLRISHWPGAVECWDVWTNETWF